MIAYFLGVTQLWPNCDPGSRHRKHGHLKKRVLTHLRLGEYLDTRFAVAFHKKTPRGHYDHVSDEGWGGDQIRGRCKGEIWDLFSVPICVSSRIPCRKPWISHDGWILERVSRLCRLFRISTLVSDRKLNCLLKFYKKRYISVTQWLTLYF